MLVTFENIIILEKHKATSSKGNVYGRLKFFDSGEAEVYEIFVFGDSVKSLEDVREKETISRISFEMRPDRNGGVRLFPAW